MRSEKIKKAKYGEDREHWYESEVHRNIYRLGLNLEIIDGDVFLADKDIKSFLCHPINEKKAWFEIWTALKSQYGNLPKFINV